MSGFQIIQTTNLRQRAVQLSVSGATCDSFKIQADGKWLFVKCLKEELQDDPKYEAIFRKEYEIGKGLSHPNLVKYNAIERTMDGICMLMDYVEGETLAERMENNPDYFLKKENVSSLLVGILNCLEYLHSNHIIHLDLKPENIMLRRVDNSPVILDLGFCYTDAYGSMIGRSEGFAAPEQFETSSERIDERTDLYALGGIIQIIDEHVKRATGKHIARKFRKLSLACLQKEINDRPKNVAACFGLIKPAPERKLAVLFTALAVSCLTLFISNLHPKVYDRDGTKYRILSKVGKTCEVTGWEKPDSVAGPFVYIKPEVEYHGRKYKTVSIADRAFEGDSSILSVFIPNGVKSIGRYAFHDCRGLSSITIPNSVETIGPECFWDARRLEEIILPSSLESLDYNTFVYCCSLKRITIPEGVRVIGKDCFVSCLALKEISLPNSLEEISRGAFYDCTSLQSISIPESVCSIGDYAFDGCVNLTDVFNRAQTPQQVTSIFGDRAGEINLHIHKSSERDYSSAPVWNLCAIDTDINH